MFGNRYLITCNDCKTEYTFKSGKRALKFYNACLYNCPRCGTHLHLWVPLQREMLTPPSELKWYAVNITVVDMG